MFFADGLEEYFVRFNALLARTDVLWTKPSEMTFFSGLGLPLMFSWPVGVHEQYNRRWAIESGPGLNERDPFAAEYGSANASPRAPSPPPPGPAS